MLHRSQGDYVVLSHGYIPTRQKVDARPFITSHGGSKRLQNADAVDALPRFLSDFCFFPMLHERGLIACASANHFCAWNLSPKTQTIDFPCDRLKLENTDN